MDIYGLIGKRLGHSFSADFFNSRFGRDGTDARYELYEIESAARLRGLVEENPELRGLNVTIPYKEDVIPLLDELDSDAQAIGAVNVIKIDRSDGRIHLKGYNTDFIGFSGALCPMLCGNKTGALVLGTGGASKAVVHALRLSGIKPFTVSRSQGKGDLTYDTLNTEILRDNLIIVNTTPLGMWPDTDSCPPIDYSQLTPAHICFDLVYNPSETKFMKLAANHGASVSNGLAMLHNQALAAWEIWNCRI